MTDAEYRRYRRENFAFLLRCVFGLERFGGHPGLIGQVLAVYIIRVVLIVAAITAVAIVAMTV
jgi:hypothetical protein